MSQTEGKSPSERTTLRGNVPVDIRVRALREGDETILATFYATLSERSRYYFEPCSDTSVEAMREVVRRAVEKEDLSLVALNESRAFAHIFYQNIAQPVPHLGIGLSDAYQDFGLGSVLLSHLISLGRFVLGKKAIGLTVMKENRRAIHLYEKLGFHIVAEVTFRIDNDSYEMRLDFRENANRSRAAV